MSISRNLAALSGLIVFLCCATVVAQPANDDCSGAISVPANTPTAWTTLAATDSVGLTCRGDQDVWYEFTAAVSGSHGFVLSGVTNAAGGTSTDTNHSVYLNPGGGVCPTNADQLMCSDPFSGSAALTAGSSYLIRIGAWSTTLTTGMFNGTLTINAPAPEICDDGVDNDFDGATDCLDFDCSGVGTCPPGPANDDCSGAIPIAANTPTPFTTLNATNSTGLSCRGTADVWFEYNATFTGNTQIALTGVTNASGGTSTDTNHSVYVSPGGGLCPTNADQVACIDPFTGTASLTAGTTYLVRVGSWSTTTINMFNGTLTVLTPTPEICNDGLDNDLDGQTDCADTTDCAADPFCQPPVNDECAGAIPAVLGVNAFDNHNANNSAETTSCPNGAINNDVFWTFTPTADGILTAYTCAQLTFDTGSSDTEIAFLEGACGALTCIASNDDSSTCSGLGGSSVQSYLSAPVLGGVPVIIRVGSFSTSSTVEGTGTWTLEFDIPGDECSNAIAAVDGSNAIDTTGYSHSADAYDDVTCPGTFLGDLGKDGWFSYTPAVSGDLAVSLCAGTTHDTDLVIYEGACGALTQVACSGDFCGLTSEVSGVPVTGGLNYMIRIGSWDPDGVTTGFSGTFDITLTTSAPEICNDGIDNDLDGDIDCADVDCLADPACAGCPTFLTQNTDPALVTNNIAACAQSAPNPPFHTENGYLRSFDTSTIEFTNCPTGIRVTGVEVGIGTATSASTIDQPARVRVWLDSNGGAPDAGMVLMAEELVSIADGTVGVLTFPFTTPAAFPIGATVVAEFFMEDGIGPGNILRMGGNTLGDTAPCYIHAPTGCGISYTPLTALGVTTDPVLNLIVDDQGAGPAGDECIFAVPVVVGTNLVDTTGFSDSAEPDPTGCTNSYGQNVSDGWYSFTAPGDGTISIDTCDPSGFDTDLALYSGSCGALSLIACNGDGNTAPGCQSFDSLIANVSVDGGTTYLIRLGGWEPGEEGPNNLNISFVPTPPVINELRIDQPGVDNDHFFELSGQPQSLDGLWYIVIGDDTSTSPSGIVESATDLTGSSIGPSGYFVAAEATFLLGVADLTTTLVFENSDNVTHLLVSGFTGLVGDDLDTDDDGVLDVTPWASIIDCIALIETVGSGDLVYCSNEVGPDGAFVPGAVERCPDTTGPFAVAPFDTVLLGDSPGSSNACLTPPANDECVTAIPAFVGDNSFFNASATDSPEVWDVDDGSGGCGTGIGHDIWFTFAAPANGTVVLDTCGLIDFDSNVAMYSGTCGSLVTIGGSCDTAGCPDFSATSAPISVNGGEVYLIRLGSWNTSPGGSGILNIGFTVQGDDCDDAVVVGEGIHPLDTTLATSSSAPAPTVPCTVFGGAEFDVWYSYTPTEDGTIDITTCDPAGFDTDIVVYTGTCAALTDVACNGDGPSDPGCQSWYSEILDFAVTGGTEYLIRVGGYFGSQGTGTLTIGFEPNAVPPTAAFTVAPLEGIAPLDVTLTDASSDGMNAGASIDIAWGDGANDNGLPVGSVVNHTYAAGTWTASVTVTNIAGSDSLLSSPIVAVAMGDCNKDGSVDIADALALAAWLFSGGPAPNCPTACDSNGDGALDLGDVVYELYYLFSGGSAPVPAAPGSGC